MAQSSIIRWPKRFNVVGLCFCAVFICYIDRVNISVAAIAMQEQFGWTETRKGFVLSSFFIGYMLAMGVAGWLSDRYGVKKVLGIAVIWWSVFTILTPFAANAGFAVLIVTRIAMGLGEAATIPGSYSMLGRWAPESEKARSISIMISGIPLGTLFGLITTGWIVSRYGWPAAFYIFGVVGIFWLPFWYFLVHDEPAKHPTISDKELEDIGVTRGAKTEAKVFPWRTFARLPAFWALLINHFCANMQLYIALAWLPSYFRNVQGLSISGAGLYSAAPWLVMFIMINVSGVIADKLMQRGMPTTTVRKIMQCIGLAGASVFLMMMPYASTANEAVILLCLILGTASFTVPGYGTNHLDIAPRHAGLLVGITNTIGTIPGVVGVAFTGWLIDTTGSYNSVFLMIAGVNLVGAVIWLIYSTGERLVD
jgi:ACS family sodium-dependent inorganic phosphate cotransporter